MGYGKANKQINVLNKSDKVHGTNSAWKLIFGQLITNDTSRLK